MQNMTGEFKERVHESFVIAAREALVFFTKWIKDNADNDDMAVSDALSTYPIHTLFAAASSAEARSRPPHARPRHRCCV